MVGHLLGHLQFAAVFQVFGNAGGSEAVAADLRENLCQACTTANHAIHISLSHGVFREQAGTTFDCAEEKALAAGPALCVFDVTPWSGVFSMPQVVERSAMKVRNG